MIELHPGVHIARVKPGDAAGLACLVELLTLLHTETPHAPLCPTRLREGIEHVLQNGYVLASVLPDGRMAGTVGLMVDAPWFSRQRWLDDRWLFVHPAARRTPHARCLIRAAKLLAQDLKLPLHMAVTGFGARIAGKIRLFARELGEPSGALWTLPAEA